jgi:hypothetical protein
MLHLVAERAQLLYRFATGWTVRGSNPGRSEIFRSRPDRPPVRWVPGLFAGCKNGRGLALITPSPSSAEVKDRVELYFYSHSGLHGLI